MGRLNQVADGVRPAEQVLTNSITLAGRTG